MRSGPPTERTCSPRTPGEANHTSAGAPVDRARRDRSSSAPRSVQFRVEIGSKDRSRRRGGKKQRPGSERSLKILNRTADLGHLSNKGPGCGGDPLAPLLGGSRETDPMTLKSVWSSPENMIELQNLMLILELEAPSQNSQPHSDLVLNLLGRPGEPTHDSRNAEEKRRVPGRLAADRPSSPCSLNGRGNHAVASGPRSTAGPRGTAAPPHPAGSGFVPPNRSRRGSEPISVRK